MADRSGILYVDHSVGFWRGCHPIAIGCAQCYGEREMCRYGHDPHQVVRARPATFYAPRKWNAAAAAAGQRRRVFVTPWSDFWIEEADAWRAEALALIRECTWLDFVSPSKRLDRAVGYADGSALPPNFWPLASVSVQDDLDRAVPHLMSLDVTLRGLSYEPALGPLDLRPQAARALRILSRHYGPEGFDPTGSQPERERDNSRILDVDWVIAGGESGPNARPLELEWLRVVRDQCARAGIAFYLKQLSGLHPEPAPRLDGRLHLALPIARAA